MKVALAVRAVISLKALKKSKNVMGVNLGGKRGSGGMSDSNLSNEINKRRTFAIISHPDDAAGYAEFLEQRYPGQGAEIALHYPFDQYPTAGQAHADIRGDFIMKCPTLNMARTYSQNNDVWMYSLEQDVHSIVMGVAALGFKSNPPALGTFHSADIGYLFEFPLLSSLARASDKRVRDIFQQAWGNFARTGNPNGEGVPEWAAFDIDRNNYLVISGEPENRDNFRNGRCDYWFEVGYGF